jgi:hypothetical protein
MHEQPGEDLPVAEYPLNERVPVGIVLPAQQIVSQGAELQFRILFHSRMFR